MHCNRETGFRSIDETLRQARALNNARAARAQRLRQPIRVDRQDAKRCLDSQEVRQETTRKRREGSYVPVAAREEFERDLAEFDSGRRYMLACVDVFSKLCATVPMDDKRPETAVAALRQCFAELGIPVRIYTNEGGEFENRTMDAFLASLQVTLVTTRSYANFVEGMIRTLKEQLCVRQLTLRRALGPTAPCCGEAVQRTCAREHVHGAQAGRPGR